MSYPKSRWMLSALSVALLAGAAAAANPPQVGVGALTPVKDMELLPVLQRAKDVGPADATQMLDVAVSLPFAQPAAAQAFADAVSNPNSPDYRQFISPEDVGARFGQPLARVQQIVDYLGQNGFSISEVGKNRLAVVARGTVAQAEAAFHTTIRSFTVDPLDPYEPGEFIAPSAPVRLPAELADAVLDVSGLDTYTRPHPLTTLLTPFTSRVCYNAQPMFTAGMTGTGRTIGVSNFDGFRSSNWPLYINHFALPVPPGGATTNITVVPCAGGGAGAGPVGGEGDLDIQMELGAAPLAKIRIYDSPPSPNLIAVLSAETSDNLCDAISESYGWSLTNTAATSAHNQHVSMSAEGITYINASGDSGTSLDPFSYPAYDPEVLSVGGTVANVNAVTGVRTSEINWTGGGGGWSTKSIGFNVRPSWQVGIGVPTINASNNKRLVPDVAFHSSGHQGAYQFYANNVLQSAIGTSFASPVFAGHLQLVSLETISLGGLVADGMGHHRFGRIQDLIYSQNNDPSIWFDITTGSSNGALPSGQGTSTPHVGWDTCVGWGPMDCKAFADAVVCATGGCAGPWTNIGFGLAGVAGIPNLVGTGTLVANSPGTLTLTAAHPLALAIQFVAFSSSPVPFKGGTLAAFPIALEIVLSTDGSGTIALPFTWPTGIPSGTALYFQYGIQDAAAVHGSALSNCEKAVTP